MKGALGRLRSARLQLALTGFAAAALWGGAAALLLFLSATVADLAVGLSLEVRRFVLPAAVAAFACCAGVVLWRGRGVLSLAQVALWIEERVPSLRYALVTALEQHPVPASQLEREVASRTWDIEVASAAARSVGRPLLPLILALAGLAFVPTSAVSRLSSPIPGDALDRVPLVEDAARSLLSPLTATIRPPSYAGAAQRVVEEPIVLEALPGAAISLRGRGASERVSVQSDRGVVRATRERDRWRIDLVVGESPVAVRLTDGTHHRLLTIEPLLDEPPVVTLSSPPRDTVMRVARGMLPLEAQASDDYGIGRSAFEYIISSGSGELFRFRTGTVGAIAAGGTRQLAMRATLPLDSLALAAGDVLHLRAVAWDANTVTGPGMGASETRTIRIARPDEYDTVAVDGAPPPDVDADAVSQRMLIIQTERLVATSRSLTRDSVITGSRQLAERQNILRRRVAEIVFMRLGVQPDAEHSHGPGDGHDHSEEELAGFLTPDRLLQEAGAAIAAQGAAALLGHGHDESPILAINQPLLEAYNHMWKASGELEIGEPVRALPPMRRALEALQKAREAERYYLRGRSARVVVDLARVRLAAPQSVRPAARASAGRADSPRARLSARLSRAAELLAVAPAAAMDSLLLVRFDALHHAPEAAPHLVDVLVMLRAGRDATEALVRARRAIDGAVQPLGSDMRWRGGW